MDTQEILTKHEWSQAALSDLYEALRESIGNEVLIDGKAYSIGMVGFVQHSMSWGQRLTFDIDLYSVDPDDQDHLLQFEYSERLVCLGCQSRILRTASGGTTRYYEYRVAERGLSSRPVSNCPTCGVALDLATVVPEGRYRGSRDGA